MSAEIIAAIGFVITAIIIDELFRHQRDRKQGKGNHGS